MNEIICWLLLTAIFIVIELATLGLAAIWFAGGAFVAAIAAALNANLVIQIILFIVVSIVLLLLTRPLAVKHLNSKTVKTNTEALIGKTAIVTQEIDNVKAIGQVTINGMEWTARAKDNSTVIVEGTRVNIVDISGVKLIVEQEITKNETVDDETAKQEV